MILEPERREFEQDMTDEERIQAEIRQNNIRREDQAKGFAFFDRQRRLNVLKTSLESYIDPFTSDAIFEFAVDVDMNLDYMCFLIAVVYTISYTLLMLMLSKICVLLPFVVAAYIYCMSPTGSVLMACHFSFWAVSRIYVFCLGKKKSVNEALRTPWSEVAAEKRGHLIWGWLDPMIINLLLVAIVALVSHQYAVTLGGVTAILTFVIMAKAIPGVGGNSTVGGLTMVFLMLISLIASPPIFSMVLDYLQDKTRYVGPAISISPIGTAHTVVTSMGTPGSIYNLWSPDPTNYGDIGRVMIGNMVMAFMILDDARGPGELLNMVTSIVSRRESLILGSASIDSGFLWIVYIIQIFFELASRNVLSVALKVISFGLAWLIWEKWGGPIWSGRGQAAAFTNGRSGVGVSMGDGPLGRRMIVSTIGLCISSVLFLITNFTDIGWGVTMIVGICSFSERFKAIALGVMTNNLGMLASGCFSKRPFTGTLQDTTRDAYTPGVGTNAA